MLPCDLLVSNMLSHMQLVLLQPEAFVTFYLTVGLCCTS
jgi:hypothetical protein